MKKAIELLLEQWYEDTEREYCFYTDTKEYKEVEEIFSQLDDLVFDLGQVLEALENKRGDM